jgi:hypothetical protein
MWSEVKFNPLPWLPLVKSIRNSAPQYPFNTSKYTLDTEIFATSRMLK